MGGCQSILRYEDDDDRIIRAKNKQYANEVREFQQQLRRQKCHSELDLSGRARTKQNVSSIATK